MRTKYKITISAMLTFMCILAILTSTARRTTEPLADTQEPIVELEMTKEIGLTSPMAIAESFEETTEVTATGMVSLYEEPTVEETTQVVVDEVTIEESYTEPITTEVPVVTEVAEPVAEGQRSLGVFTITAYCGCEKCCGVYAENRGDVVTGALGVPLTANYSIAVDPNVISFYSTVYINGQPYVAHDTGGAIKGNRIDIYMDNHQDALNWGVRTVEVFY